MTADSDLFNTELPAQQAEDPQALRGLTNDELDAVLSKSGDQDPATTRRLLAMRDKDTLVRVDRALVSEFGGVWQKSKAAVSEGMKGLSRALLSTYDLSQEVGGQTPDGQWTFGGQVSKDVRETVRGQINDLKAAPLTRSENWMENAYYDFLSAMPTVAAQIGATVLNPALGTAFMSAVVAGSTNEDLQGVDLKYRLPAVTLDATVGAALERVGIGRVLPRGVLSKGFEKELVRRALKGVATDPVVKRTILGAFGKSLAGAVGAEAVTESLQSVSNQLIVDMTKSLDDANGDWNLAADNFVAQLDPADVAKQAAWEGLIGGMFGFLGVARAAQDASVAAERTKSMVSAANVIAKAVNQDQAIEAAGAIAQKTGMSEEFVVMDSMLFQEKFGDRASEVAAKMGITQDQFDLALATGSELEVPAVHALLAGEDLQLIAPILKHVGIDAGRLNLAENSTGDIFKQVSGMVETSLTPNAKPVALKQKIDEIYTAATEAGIAKFTKGDADAIGSLLYARARVFAPELGLTVDEYLAQAPAFTATETGVDAKGAIDRSTKLISLFKGEADRSTILHEMFHGFHLELMDVAPSSQVAQETLVAFDEFTKDISGEREKMEHLAKAFETYLQEGKAPSAPLKRAFTKFKTWLVAIYRSLGIGGVKLNDEIRGTFDRMLATENEIDVIQAEYGLTENFTTFLGEYLTPKTKKVIDDAKKQTDAEMESKMLHRSIRAYAKRSGKEEAIRKDVAKRVKEDPAYEALKYVTAEGGVRKDELIALVGEKKAEALIAANPKVIGGGLSLDSLNAHLALQPTPSNAVDLFSTLASYPDVDTRIEELVETELALYEEAVRSGKAEQEALDAAEETDDTPEEFLSESRLEYLTMQYAALTQKIEASQLRSFARAEIAATKMAAKKALETQPSAKAVNAAGYTRAASKHAKEAVKIAKRLGAMNVKEDATAKKSADVVDTTGSVTQIEGAMDAVAKAEESRRSLEEKLEVALRAQKLCHAMAMEAMKLNKERNKILASVKKLTKSKSKTIAQNYADLIRDIANTYGLPSSPVESAEYMMTLEAFAASGNDELSVIDLTAPGWLQGYKDPRVAKPYGELDMVQLRELDDYLKLIKAQGNLEMEAMKRMVGEENKDDVVAKLVAQVGKRGEADKSIRTDNDTAKFLLGLQGEVRAHTLAPQAMMKMADLGDPNGEFQRIILYPLERLLEKKLSHARRLTKNELKAFGVLRENFTKRVIAERGAEFLIEDLPMERTGYKRMTPERAIAAIMNCGTQSGKDALLGGFGWDESHLDKIKALFTKEDIEMFKLVWAMNDSLFAGADDADFEIYGRRAKKLKPEPVEFTFGDEVVKLDGGYYHLSYNPEESLKVSEYTIEDILKSNGSSSQRMLGTKRGSMKDRTGVKTLPVRLDLGVMGEHIAETLHHTYFGSYLNDLSKVVKDPIFAKAFSNAFGVEKYKQLIPWLRAIARPQEQAPSKVTSFMNWLVGANAASALGFKLTTMLKNGSAFFNVAAKIGWKTYASGISASMANPYKTFQEIIELDPRMEDRLTSILPEMAQLLRKPRELATFKMRVNGKIYTKESFMSLAMGGIMAVDSMTTFPAYLGVYRKVMHETGDSDAAKDAAWRAVVDTQPYSNPIYQPLMATGDHKMLYRFIMPLSGWIVKLGGVLRTDYHLWQNGAISPLQFGYRFSLNVLAPSIFSAMIGAAFYGDDDDDAGDFVKDVALDATGATLGWIPFASTGVAVAQFGKESVGKHPALQVAIKGIFSPMAELAKVDTSKDKAWDGFLWSLCEAAGVWTKTPVTNAYKSVAQGVELIEDEEDSR